jgi:hypothetical protein
MKYIHYRFGHPPKPRGGLTIAYNVDGHVAVYSVARCSPKDNFNKRVGRAIATGRYDKSIATGEVRSVTLHGEPKTWPQQIINHYADSGE